MKILQAVASSAVKNPDGSEEPTLVCCSKAMPEAIRKEALELGKQSEASGEATHSIKTVQVDSVSWLLLNRAVPPGDHTGGEGHVSHTLAIREDELVDSLDSSGGCLPSALGFARTFDWVKSWSGETRWLEGDDEDLLEPSAQEAEALAQSHLESLLGKMKRDFSEKAQEKSEDARKRFEEIVAEFRREVVALQNRVEEYSNAKWWLFEGEDEIKRRRSEINQLEQTARKAAEAHIKEYREKASPVLRALSDPKVSPKEGVLAEPGCFPKLLAKFDKLADNYKEFSRIVAICDRANISDTNEKELIAANAKLGEQLAEAKRELEVSKVSDKIMSSKMKTDRKHKARALAGKSSLISGQAMAIIILSLALAASLAMQFLGGPDDPETNAAATEEIESAKKDWAKEKKALNDQLRKAQADGAALEAKIKTLEAEN